MAARVRRQPQDGATGRFIPTWKWQDQRGQRSLYWVDPAVPEPEPPPWWTTGRMVAAACLLGAFLVGCGLLFWALAGAVGL